MAIKILSPDALIKRKKTPAWFPMWLRSTARNEIDGLIIQVKELQITSAAYLSRIQDGSVSDSNEYVTHESQTEEIISKYSSTSEFGSTLMKRLVNVSASLQVPNGVELDGDPATQEYAYLKLFIEKNQLNEGVAIQLAKEAQFNGQVLINLLWETSDENMVRMKYLPWIDYKYVVETIGLSNLTAPYKAIWEVENSPKSLEKDEIAFIAFNKTISENQVEGWPTLGNVLMRLDDIGKDLLAWRQSNKLYASPTPVFTCETQEEVTALTSSLAASGWTVGTALAFRGKFALVATSNSHATIKDAIENNVKLVSGASGVSIAWLGFADVMSNRATADSLGEPLEIMASADLTTWRSFYEEMFDNVIKIRNANINSAVKLKTGIVKPKLKPMSDRQWAKLKDLFMPAADKGLLTRETFLNMIPNFDVEKELKLIEKEDAEKEPEIDLSEVEEVELEEE